MFSSKNPANVEQDELDGDMSNRSEYIDSPSKNKDVYLKPSEQPVKANSKEYITSRSFIENFTKIFIGSLDTKIRFTFDMYDFDNDSYITPEDMRIMLSYMPFERNIQLNAAQK